ncbi:uncharacterized protein [Watersipora subatra]|uniref:uncharacterized protein n=1 Tax=Watersipora subatra TaxID=2589382 RepID=UPI00355BCDED
MAGADSFLVPKPLQEEGDLSTQWTRFKEEFGYYLIAAEKLDKDDKIKIALLLMSIGPKGTDIFKSFKFGQGKSKEVYQDVLEKFDQTCNKTSNKILKRHQLLSMKQGSLSVDEYITELHKIARECSLGEMYEEFMVQALLLGITDDRLRRKLFEESEGITLEAAVKKCKTSETSNADLQSIKTEESVYSFRDHSSKDRKMKTEDGESGRSCCGHCGGSHPPCQCPAYGKQCAKCKKYNHYKAICRSKRKQHVHALTNNQPQESDSDSTESLLCIQDGHTELKSILEQHQSVFKSTECLPGKYSIEVDPSVKPTQCQNYKVAISMRNDLKDKLQSLTEADIAGKVDYSTPWISHALTRRKPNGKLRLCIDPANLNKAIKRNHFPMLTLEVILSELDGAKVYSLSDAKDGFLQIKLDKQSSDLTTFWTPFGKYMWLRMPFGLSSSPEEFQ